jgi:hypothetical protein
MEVWKWVPGIMDNQKLVEISAWVLGSTTEQRLGTDVFVINRGSAATLKFANQGLILLPSVATPTPPDEVIVKLFEVLRAKLLNAVIPDLAIYPNQKDMFHTVVGQVVDDKTIDLIKKGRPPVYTLDLLKYTDDTVPAGKFIYTETCIYAIGSVVHYCDTGHNKTYMSN